MPAITHSTTAAMITLDEIHPPEQIAVRRSVEGIRASRRRDRQGLYTSTDGAGWEALGLPLGCRLAAPPHATMACAMFAVLVEAAHAPRCDDMTSSKTVPEPRLALFRQGLGRLEKHGLRLAPACTVSRRSMVMSSMRRGPPAPCGRRAFQW